MSLPTSYLPAFIGLGSNLENPLQQVNQARLDIAQLPDVVEIAFSPLYQSQPVGPQDQPDYINAVMHIGTRLPALDLLRQLQQIENAHGRLRSVRWGARTLDLDILLYADQIIDLPDLQVPHPELVNRAFVLYPLADIAGTELLVPGKGSLQQLLASGPSAEGMQRLAA
ncbi:2-amino-4-hydroxy-6-hydroxymethyldihydropteridine diphosphokinase [Methylomonas paludis]|uniref:2-amino-4-hydroxy-6-hydroxymethyldihydropteridine pyrophosphokinase n=1 Tax=Methylomonas paludis TaxID=1173101 RepID=A0A975MNT9_9GAMM|nr:2-amino-4-hydroxy-6-hydroxymethyldihydropteridine diphosphokinase [Methylomonas paludis]QWF70781.1 2-amino-4-hydroxy-6-hydroxymethyldihydropteridine diphosphokinase [Methylomonas paludis]